MNSKKNILLVTPSKIGLTETFIKAHIEGLNGNVFYLYGYDLEFKDQDDRPLKTIYEPLKSSIDKVKTLLPYYAYFRLEQQRKETFTKEALIKRYIKDHNISLVFAEYGTSGSFIAPICIDLGIPLIVHFHGFDASTYKVLDEFKNGYKLMFDYAECIIVVSNEMKKALMRIGCKDSKLIVNACGPNSDYHQISADYASNHIVAVGRHTYKKAPYLTILAFQKVLKNYPDLKLSLIGTGELYEVSKNMVKSLGLENHIVLPGGLERKDIIPYLKKSFLFVQHSLVAGNGDSEGMPVGIMEAMAAGLPVVSTRHAGIPDVVIENETGFLVDEGDIDSMATYIEAIAENRALAKKMGLKGKQIIAENYTIEKHLEIINKAIENAI